MRSFGVAAEIRSEIPLANHDERRVKCRNIVSVSFLCGVFSAFYQWSFYQWSSSSRDALKVRAKAVSPSVPNRSCFDCGCGSSPHKSDSAHREVVSIFGTVRSQISEECELDLTAASTVVK